MKKLISITMSLIMLLSAVGCSSSGSGNNNDSVQESGSENTLSAENSVESVSFTGDVTGEITVRCYETYSYKTYLDNAAMAFENKYPGTKINVETFSAMPEIKTLETEDGAFISVITMDQDESAEADYLTQLNAELMSGKGPDIMAMDVIPWYKYADSGFLEDLSGYMDFDPEFNTADYWMNIINGSAYKGGIYQMPIDYMYDVLTYNTALVEEGILPQKDTYTYTELYELLKNQITFDDENRLFSYYGMENAFLSFFYNEYEKFVDLANGRGAFTDGYFEELLEFAKMLQDEGYIREYYSMDYSDIDIDSFVTESTEDVKYALSEVSNTILLYMLYDSGLSFSFGSYDPLSDNRNELLGSIANEDGDVLYSFQHAFGINANSENKELSWAFIKFLTSYDMQISTDIFGSVIHKEAFKERTRLEITGLLYEEDRSMDTVEMDEEQQKIYDRYIELTEKYNSNLTKYKLNDSVLDEMIISELMDFFEGKKSANEVAEKVQSRVDLYLNE